MGQDGFDYHGTVYVKVGFTNHYALENIVALSNGKNYIFLNS